MTGLYNAKTDLRVNLFLPQNNKFIFGLSKWDGSDTWGTTGDDTLVTTNIIDDVYSIDTEIGYDLESGIFARPMVGTATIQLKGSKYDPTFDKRYRPNVYVEIRADTSGVSNIPVFTGFIQSVNTEYTIDGLTLVTLRLVDRMQKFLNGVYPTWSTGVIYPYSYELMQKAIDLSGLTSNYTFRAAPTIADLSLFNIQDDTNVQTSDIINRIIDGEGGVLFGRADGSIWFYARRSNVGDGLTPWLVATSEPATGLGQITYSSINVENNSNNVVNKITAELASDPAIKVIGSDEESISMNGEQAAVLTADLIDKAELQKLVNDMSLTSPGLTVKSLEFSAINRDGYLHWRAVRQNPQTYIDIIFNNDAISYSGTFIVNKVKHSITADNWFTTLETWKGI